VICWRISRLPSPESRLHSPRARPASRRGARWSAAPARGGRCLAARAAVAGVRVPTVAVVAGGRTYVLGGHDSGGGTISNVYVVDPARGTSRRAGPKSQTRPLLPPKGADPGPPRSLPCARVFSRDRRQGPSSPSWTPPSRRCDGRAEAVPPLWQYLWRLLREKPLELMCAPKGVGPLWRRTFNLQRGNFCGCRSGGQRCRSWTPAAAGASARVAGGEGHAAVVAVLVPAVKEPRLARPAPSDDAAGHRSRFRG
jgi:hypothetical protein